MNETAHAVTIKKDTKLYEIYQKDTISVNSFHHQGVKQTGLGMIVSAKSSDGVIEATEYNEERFIVTVQWHPEMMIDSAEQKKLFRAFIEAAKKGQR